MCFYNQGVKTWDGIVVGAGIIGLTLASELQRRGMRVLIVERGEPGREASWAAGGMLADCALETPQALQTLATASARMYPGFARAVEEASGMTVDLRQQGTILFPEDGTVLQQPEFAGRVLHSSAVIALEPNLAAGNRKAVYLAEGSVDPRALTAAAAEAARRAGVDFRRGETVTGLDPGDGAVTGVTTTAGTYAAPVVVNCAGAWAGQIRGGQAPTHPVKGQMLCLLTTPANGLAHVVRTPEAYLIPRSNGRLLIGATLEDAGFDKQMVPKTLERLHRAALTLAPRLQECPVVESWAGLRPGTRDGLPLLGAGGRKGYYIATGHYRDGILLAPVTARLMARLICGEDCEHDLGAFSPMRFGEGAKL